MHSLQLYQFSPAGILLDSRAWEQDGLGTNGIANELSLMVHISGFKMLQDLRTLTRELAC